MRGLRVGHTTLIEGEGALHLRIRGRRVERIERARDLWPDHRPADAILDGERLIPHWRFREGVNFRRVFEEPGTFDLVLWITGPAALPYLEEGVETSGEDWARIDDILRGGLAAYAAWFN